MRRLFSGIELPPGVARRLTFVRAGLNGAHWIDSENYHVTLRFLGDVDGTTARDFAHGLEDIVASPFELRLKTLGSFGGHKPRAIFAAVAPSSALESLQRAHERAAQALIPSPPILSAKVASQLSRSRSHASCYSRHEPRSAADPMWSKPPIRWNIRGRALRAAFPV